MPTVKCVRKYFTNSTEYSYSDLTNITEDQLFSFLRDRDFLLTRYDISELHDRYEDFDAFSCSSFDELLAERPWESIYGYWTAQGTYDGAEVHLGSRHPSGIGFGMYFRVADEDAKRIAPLIAAFDHFFAPERADVVDWTLVSYPHGNRHITIEGVSSIGRDVFQKDKDLESVTIGWGVERVGDNAFFGCSNLSYLRISESVTCFGSQALCGCDKLTTAGPSLRSVERVYGHQATRFRDRLQYHLEFDHVDVLPEGMCYNLQHLVSVEIPRTIKTIGKSCFWNCKQLREVVVPESVTAIESGAFRDCKGLERLVLPKDTSGITIADSAFKGCEALADEDGFVVVDGVLYDYVGKSVHLTIPTNVRRIAASAFVRGGVDTLGISRRHIESVTIPGSVKEIGESAFANSVKLREVTLGEGIESIGKKAFAGCKLLGVVAVPHSVTFVGEDAFPTPYVAPPVPKATGTLRTIASNKDREAQVSKKLQSHSVTNLGPAGPQKPGTLHIGGGFFTFKAAGDREGHPSLSGSFVLAKDALVLDKDVLTVVSKGKEQRFRIDAIDLGDVELQVLYFDDLYERFAPYASPLADACADNSWPNVTHPFFEAHATDQTDVRGVFELVASDARLRALAFADLPWLSYDVSIKQWENGLLVSVERGAERYSYREVQDEIGLSYYSHEVGFFDDSEREESIGTTLRYVSRQPEAERNGLLENPCGLVGAFALSRD